MVAERTGTRSRTNGNGAVPRRKRSDTHVGTIERQSGLDFGVRSDMHLATLLERRNSLWLAEILYQHDQDAATDDSESTQENTDQE
jgi:hypothetical protein